MIKEDATAIARYFETKLAKIKVLYGKRFQDTFNTPIDQFKGTLGFDMIAFDSFINPKQNSHSLAEIITNLYGVSALELIREIIAYESTEVK